jgi:photosynthetic reaction center M subunit
MIRYQNMFTQVQLRGPMEPGPALRDPNFRRLGNGSYHYWLGKVGASQIGPIYLGTLGMASLVFAFFAFEIIGLNMLASVNWDPIQFVRQLPWLALEPPGRNGLHARGSAGRGRLVADRRLLHDGIAAAVVAADLPPGA